MSLTSDRCHFLCYYFNYAFNEVDRSNVQLDSDKQYTSSGEFRGAPRAWVGPCRSVRISFNHRMCLSLLLGSLSPFFFFCAFFAFCCFVDFFFFFETNVMSSINNSRIT